jgi:hypothetical protein
LVLGMRYGRVLLADDSDAEPLFREALAFDFSGWRFYEGRINLTYGQWLRRQRRIVESRVPLRRARDIFDALGFTAYTDRARLELRSAGEPAVGDGVASPANGSSDRFEALTPQELQIIRLAAEGLTNR